MASHTTGLDDDSQPPRNCAGGRIQQLLQEALDIMEMAEEASSTPGEASLSAQPTVVGENERGRSSMATGIGRAFQQLLARLGVTSDPSDLPTFTPEEEAEEAAMLSDVERQAIQFDVLGGTTERLDLQRRLDDVDRELRRIPPENKRAFLRGQVLCPELFLNASRSMAHVNFFLILSNYDPRLAAERLVKYWDRRVHLLGDRAFPDRNPAALFKWEYHQMYSKCQEAATDPDTDEQSRRIAKNFLGAWVIMRVNELDRELMRIPPGDKAALANAQRTWPGVAASVEHKLRFLRSVDFDAKSAAQRMVGYWETRNDLFGMDGGALPNPLTAEALMRDHTLELWSGAFQLLPGTDRFGRAVLLMRRSNVYIEGYTHEGVLKVLWYMLDAALERTRCPSSGIVFICDARETASASPDFQLVAKLNRMGNNCVPVGWKALHLCTSPYFFAAFIPFVKFLIGTQLRSRLRVYSSSDEMLTQLEICGISRDQMPTDLGGSVEFDSFREWLEERRGSE